MNSLGQTYLESVVKRMLTYKELGEKTFLQLEEKDFHYQPNASSNSIAIIIRHLSGNMLSRWTNFLTEDGEKEGRERDTEFGPPTAAGGKGLLTGPAAAELASKAQLLDLWKKGWDCLMDTLRSLKEEDLLKTIHIRHEPLTAIDAINRQLAHYPHHVGQIVYIGKLIKNESWTSLSIPRGQSEDFNRQMKERPETKGFGKNGQ